MKNAFCVCLSQSLVEKILNLVIGENFEPVIIQKIEDLPEVQSSDRIIIEESQIKPLYYILEKRQIIDAIEVMALTSRKTKEVDRERHAGKIRVMYIEASAL
ncbi:MAG: hypothetical protein WCJ29_02670 [bacterium]